MEGILSFLLHANNFLNKATISPNEYKRTEMRLNNCEVQYDHFVIEGIWSHELIKLYFVMF